jgi:hypothetical protein
LLSDGFASRREREKPNQSQERVRSIDIGGGRGCARVNLWARLFMIALVRHAASLELSGAFAQDREKTAA